jgi:BASS family bile acid:Na+ symporter
MKNRNIVFLSAVGAGLLFPALSFYLIDAVLISLVIIMTLSLAQIVFEPIYIKKQARQAFVAFLMNYVLLTGIILLSTRLLTDPDLIVGFVVMAAVPPAIAVIPFTNFLRGDAFLSLVSSTLLYLISPILVPLIVHLGAGFKGIDTTSLIKVLVELIILPIGLSRIIIRLDFYERIKRSQDVIINFFFFILIYAVVGVNQRAFFQDTIGIISAICFLRTFVVGTFVHSLAKFLGIDEKTAITYTLFSSYKNLGLTATMALALVGERACIPAAVCIPFEVFLFTYYSKVFKS